MKLVVFPEPVEDRPLVFFLSAEECLARTCGEELLMVWRVPPTVIFGRNQDMEAEVDVPYCRQEGIMLFRRKSGGGCVYADKGNIMVSAVTSGNDKTFLFDRFISTFALFLRKQGFDAWPSGRNDILVSGRKVSGSAFYSLGRRNVIHATLLCDVDLGKMQRAITPSREKLLAKGVASVRQRVANLSNFAPVDIAAMEQAIAGFFCDGERMISGKEMEDIGRIMAGYLDEGFITGRRPGHNVLRTK